MLYNALGRVVIGVGSCRDVYCGRVRPVFAVIPDMAAIVTAVVIDPHGEEITADNVNRAPRLRAQRTEAIGHSKNRGRPISYTQPKSVVKTPRQTETRKGGRYGCCANRI